MKLISSSLEAKPRRLVMKLMNCGYVVKKSITQKVLLSSFKKAPLKNVMTLAEVKSILFSDRTTFFHMFSRAFYENTKCINRVIIS